MGKDKIRAQIQRVLSSVLCVTKQNRVRINVRSESKGGNWSIYQAGGVKGKTYTWPRGNSGTYHRLKIQGYGEQQTAPKLTHHITWHQSRKLYVWTQPSSCEGGYSEKKSSRVETEEYVNIPEYYYKLHKFVVLKAYVIFADWNYCIITSARKLKLLTVKNKHIW